MHGSSAPSGGARVFSVGLTGGIASGKSLVAAMFVDLGAALVDTDAIARDVVAAGQPALAAVREALGPGVLTTTGELDRAAVRALVFEDPAKRRTLESILHPAIRERTLAALAAVERRYAIVAVPLLVETDFAALVDRVLVVDCPAELQLERLMRRDALPRAAALAMIGAQADRVTRLKAAHDVIDNSGDRVATRRQVEQLHRRYLELATRATSKN
jgi:dephospho-CoA kinase